MTRQAIESENTRISRLVAALPCALDDLGVLAIEGPDALAFAQAQLASDLAALAPGHWHWTCVLSAQGRVLAFGPLLREAPERLAWVLPAGRIDGLAAGLRRFVLRRKVSIQRGATAVCGSAGAPPAGVPLAGGAVVAGDGRLGLVIGGVGGRTLWLGTAGPPSPVGVEAWRALDVLDGLPRIEGAAVDAWTAHALGLQRVAAFSTRKGCYPGQEIIARTHFLGRNKREPRVGWMDEVAEAGARLLAPDDADAAEAMGEVVCAAATAEPGCVVLAVVREDAPARLRLAGTPAAALFEPLALASAGQK